MLRYWKLHFFQLLNLWRLLHSGNKYLDTKSPMLGMVGNNVKNHIFNVLKWMYCLCKCIGCCYVWLLGLLRCMFVWVHEGKKCVAQVQRKDFAWASLNPILPCGVYPLLPSLTSFNSPQFCLKILVYYNFTLTLQKHDERPFSCASVYESIVKSWLSIGVTNNLRWVGGLEIHLSSSSTILYRNLCFYVKYWIIVSWYFPVYHFL